MQISRFSLLCGFNRVSGDLKVAWLNCAGRVSFRATKRLIHAILDLHAPIGYQGKKGFHYGQPRPKSKWQSLAPLNHESISCLELRSALGTNPSDDVLALRSNARLSLN